MRPTATHGTISSQYLREACLETIECVYKQRLTYQENEIQESMTEWNAKIDKYPKWLRFIGIRPWTRKEVVEELESRDGLGFPRYHSYWYNTRVAYDDYLSTAYRILRLLDVAREEPVVKLSSEDAQNLFWPKEEKNVS